MNRFPKRLVTALIAAILVISMPFAFSAAGIAGTADDPLVTLSYVNGTLKEQLKQEIYTELYAQIKEQLAADLRAEILATMGNTTVPGTTTPAAEAGYTVISLGRGQRLDATAACEIILSSGSAVCYVTSQANIDAQVGLRDCTDGSEILNGVPIPSRHYVIIPRGDGRGALVTSDVAYFMVRGEYQIVG